jgi:general secretion pathway protein F
MKLSRKEWNIFCFQAAMLLNQDFLLQDVFDIISRSRTRKRVKILSQRLKEEMEKGFALHEALKNICTKIETYLYASISAGEQSSTLTSAFQNLYHHMERKNQLEIKLKSTSVYPLIVLSISVILAVALVSFIVPIITQIADTLAADLPKNTRQLIAFWQWISVYRWVVLASLVFLGIGTVFLWTRMKYFFHTFFLYLPFIGEWIKKKDLWKFFSTMSLMMESHVSADLALTVSAETVSNIRLSEEISLAMAPLQQGESLSGSLQRFRISSEYLYSLLKTGEESNRMAQNARFIAEALQMELHASYEQWVKLAEPVLFLIIGMIVLWIVFSAYLPMLSMFQWDAWGLP